MLSSRGKRASVRLNRSPFRELTSPAFSTSSTTMIGSAHFSLRIVSMTLPGPALPQPRCDPTRAKLAGSPVASTTVVGTSSSLPNLRAQCDLPIPGGPSRRSGANLNPGRPSRTDCRIACQMCSVAGPIQGISSCKVAARTSASCSLKTLETVAPFCSLRRPLRSLVLRCCIPVAASCRSTYLKARLSILILSCVEREFP